MSAIRYVGTGKTAPKVAITISLNGGKAWKERALLAVQTFHIPPNCTNLLIDNVQYDPKGSSEIREGRVAPA